MNNYLDKLKDIIYTYDDLIDRWCSSIPVSLYESEEGESVYVVADNLRNTAISIIEQMKEHSKHE